jgi:small nuclear ribonucleoprotein (snRNP)-like protein
VRAGRVLRSKVRRRVIVTLKSGDAFAGVLTSGDRQSIVLQQAEAAGRQGAHVAVDGELLLFVEDVAYLQFP